MGWDGMGGVTGMGWEVWEMLWGRTVSCYGVRMEMLQGWDGMGDASCLHCSPAVWCCSTGGSRAPH